jgi:hypothetical protein
VEGGVAVRVDGLRPRRAVNVHDGRDGRAALRTDGADVEHELHRAGGLGNVEPLGCMLDEHGGSERPERLTPLDPVKPALAVRQPGVAEDVPRAEGARTEFSTAMEPADDAPGRSRSATCSRGSPAPPDARLTGSRTIAWSTSGLR